MGKTEFLKALRRALRRAPDDEREKALTYYSEMIDDRVEEGLTEEHAVAAIGGVSAAAEQVLTELAGEGKLKKKLTGSQLALIIISSVIWLPLLITAIGVAITLIAAMWSAIAGLWAAVIGLAAGVLGGAVEIFIVSGVPMKLVMCGMTLGCLGGAILGSIGMKKLSRLAGKTTFSVLTFARRYI